MANENRVQKSETLRGEQAYVYGLKARAMRHHCLGYGTFSVNLETLGRLRKEYSRRIAPITYVPIYIRALALTLERSPKCNAILFKKPFGLRIVRFQRVDVNFPITRRVGDRLITFIGCVRSAGVKPLAEIQAEITEYERCPAEKSFAIRRFFQFDRAPLWIANLIHRRMTWDPAFYVRNVGTCGLTFLEGDWFERIFPIAPTSVVFGIGAACKEPVVEGDAIVARRMLHCCLMADNYVISGPMGLKLARDFRELLETGSFVKDEIDRLP